MAPVPRTAMTTSVTISSGSMPPCSGFRRDMLPPRRRRNLGCARPTRFAGHPGAAAATVRGRGRRLPGRTPSAATLEGGHIILPGDLDVQTTERLRGRHIAAFGLMRKGLSGVRAGLVI